MALNAESRQLTDEIRLTRVEFKSTNTNAQAHSRTRTAKIQNVKSKWIFGALDIRWAALCLYVCTCLRVHWIAFDELVLFLFYFLNCLYRTPLFVGRIRNCVFPSIHTQRVFVRFACVCGLLFFFFVRAFASGCISKNRIFFAHKFIYLFLLELVSIVATLGQRTRIQYSLLFVDFTFFSFSW